MFKVIAATIAIAGVVALTAPVNAATARQDGLSNSTQTMLSAAPRHHRRYSHARRYTYPTYGGMYPYGYYGPRYYERPYARPAPLWFGLGGWW
jgi:hypothetical protein